MQLRNIKLNTCSAKSERDGSKNHTNHISCDVLQTTNHVGMIAKAVPNEAPSVIGSCIGILISSHAKNPSKLLNLFCTATLWPAFNHETCIFIQSYLPAPYHSKKPMRTGPAVIWSFDFIIITSFEHFIQSLG